MLVEASKNQSQLINRKLTDLSNRVALQSGGLARAQPVPTGDGERISHVTQLPTDRQTGAATRPPVNLGHENVNDLEAFADVFKGIEPWSGFVQPQYIVDFLGMQIDIEFHPMLFTDPNFKPEVVGGVSSRRRFRGLPMSERRPMQRPGSKLSTGSFRRERPAAAT